MASTRFIPFVRLHILHGLHFAAQAGNHAQELLHGAHLLDLAELLAKIVQGEGLLRSFFSRALSPASKASWAP